MARRTQRVRRSLVRRSRAPSPEPRVLGRLAGMPHSLSRSAVASAVVAAAVLGLSPATFSQRAPRARDLGVPFDGTPGAWQRHHRRRRRDRRPLDARQRRRQARRRAGPGAHRRHGGHAARPRLDGQAVFAAWYTLNGNGEMTGTTWVEESGFLEAPVMITNTHSVGVVRDAVIEWDQARPAGCAGYSVISPAGRRRDLRRLSERHQRLPREEGARL